MDITQLKIEFLQKFPSDEIVEMESLSGQASNRRYFRLAAKSGKTYILMQLPVGEAAQKSEEITALSNNDKTSAQRAREGEAPAEFTSAGGGDANPFVVVQSYLRRVGISVPQIYLYLEKEGQLLLEDLGDRSLEQAILGAPNEFVFFYYKKAIDLLLDWQKKTASSPKSSHIAFERSFTFDLLYWECEHFLEYGVEDYYKIKIAEGIRKPIEEEFKRLCRELVELPSVLVHRDFQSRNLHLHNYQMMCIDFQDALLGPFVYDLVALLRDSYVVLAPEVLAALKDVYWEGIRKSGQAGRWSLDRARFDRAFHLQTAQRKLKDAGRFQYIHTVKKNSQFLPCRKPSLAYVAEALAALPDYAALREAIVSIDIAREL